MDGDTEEEGLHVLYGVQDKVAETIAKVLGIENELALEQIDAVLVQYESMINDKCGRDSMPDVIYEDVLRTVRSLHITLPWEKKPEEGICCRHSGQIVGSHEVKTGWLWNGSSHAYIIPGNLGISYDEKTGVLTAHVVEVDKKTIVMKPEEQAY